MKVEYLGNGDLLVSSGSKPIFVAIGILIFLVMSSGAFMWMFSEEGITISSRSFLALLFVISTIVIF